MVAALLQSSVAPAPAPDLSLNRLQFARSRLAPAASGSLDPGADPDLAPSAEMRACGDKRVSCDFGRETRNL